MVYILEDMFIKIAVSKPLLGEFQQLKNKTEGLLLELLRNVKESCPNDKDAILHAQKQLTAVKNTYVSMQKKRRPLSH